METHVVILAGGAGTRLWPLSSKNQTKPFLSLPYKTTLIEQAVARARCIVSETHIWIVTVAEQVKQVQKALPHFDSRRIIAEPKGRNTAAAACLATFQIQNQNSQPKVILLLPADHYIPDQNQFSKYMKRGIRRALEGQSLITFGLPVKEPRSDFGYIEVKKGSSHPFVFPVRRFVEKPPMEKAKKYFRSKNFFWNSGMFAWRSDLFFKEIQMHAPFLFEAFSSLPWNGSIEKKTLAKIYSFFQSISVDYALMEKSHCVEVVPVDFSWSDVGTWDALAQALAKKRNDNVILGLGQVIGGKRNFVRSPNHPIYVFGLDDLVVVDTPECSLITTREQSHNLRTLVQNLSKK